MSLAVYASAVGLAGWRVTSGYEDDFRTPFPHREAPWVTSEACRSCHPDHHASWERTFHRTMTQEASAASVVGAFDGRVVTFWGIRARPVERNGRFLIEYLGPEADTGEGGDEVQRTLEIARTVGSRRYQQYLVQDPEGRADNYYRIPLLWHIEEERWIHLNGAFLGPDDPNYDKHVALWNDNCIFCHNTGPVPGLDNYDELVERRTSGEAVDISSHGQFRSEVTELGIACESCHGPAGEHAERNRDPLRRYALHFTNKDDPTIVHPAKLDGERSVAVCGQCHGQRMPKTNAGIVDWMRTGPTYRAGEDLSEAVRLVWRDTPPPVPESDGFALRFWKDGTPRLTAYEYQGILSSPCYQRGELTCLSCHSMHGGDVFGQLAPEKRTNQACLQCHGEIARDISAHTHHELGSSGSSCYECHMPKAVYGILAIHRSHRIENPDIARDTATDRPNACTSCHLDRSPVWVAERTSEWWGGDLAALARTTSEAPVSMSGWLAGLHAGDPVQRAVAAEASARVDTPLSPRERVFIVPHLLLALFDTYPAVRWFARRSLEDLSRELATAGIDLGLADGADAFDYLADVSEREEAVKGLMRLFRENLPGDLTPPPEGTLLNERFEPDMDEILRLMRMQSTKVIQIGE